ncbi:hypothetical protein LINPERHAP2_LOCUS16088 [Linum perenne]
MEVRRGFYFLGSLDH